ncbi:MAG: hypothetical protein IAF38_06330 [Bacteroidia bacterium]|nr:hypothetical protein [Bacteroidia bacterium]
MHFKNDGAPDLQNQYGTYDFKVYNVKAHDRPDFNGIQDLVNITIPQFNFRIGYFFNNKRDEGIELNYDHAKYVVDDWQTVRMKGSAFGRHFDNDTILDPANFHFEHTDGANFWNFNYVRRWNLLKSKNEKYKLNFIGRAGLGFVMPRTDITIFGNRVNNNWKIAGMCANTEMGLRGEFWKHLVLEFTGKAVAADYASCLVQGKGNGKASHFMLAAELIGNIGYQF